MFINSPNLCKSVFPEVYSMYINYVVKAMGTLEHFTLKISPKSRLLWFSSLRSFTAALIRPDTEAGQLKVWSSDPPKGVPPGWGGGEGSVQAETTSSKPNYEENKKSLWTWLLSCWKGKTLFQTIKTGTTYFYDWIWPYARKIKSLNILGNVFIELLSSSFWC